MVISRCYRLRLAAFQLDDRALEALRRYLTCVRFAQHSMPDEVHETVQQDFVRARQQDPSVNGDTFHRWLTLARYMARALASRSVLP
jgi:hypothetical protein